MRCIRQTSNVLPLAEAGYNPGSPGQEMPNGGGHAQTRDRTGVLTDAPVHGSWMALFHTLSA